MGISERKQREKEQRLESIIQAAESLFLRKGISHTTMEEIARACELSKAALYLYFRSKEQLLLTIIIRAFDTLYDMLKAVYDSETSASDKARAMGRTYLDFYRQYPGYYGILNHQHESEDEVAAVHKHVDEEKELLQQMISAHNRIWELSINGIRAGIQSGEFKPDTNPQEVVLLLVAGSDGVIRVMEQHRIHLKFAGPDEAMPFGSVDLEEAYIKIWEYTIDSIVTRPEEISAKRPLWKAPSPSAKGRTP
jgi:AcrR family transcriptional regulator